ncbi:hypothetical protein ACDY96_32220 [Rhizobium mongolense]|uniref:hypothetical protein n=1 Tax=Rhizobium TaxID=379 RepID=UPI0024B07D9C|nr:hypothetical protein [Rhizobium sp. CC1099]WFU87103.1 hypothetical protein QA644_18790 [Rhizobium sp. CC1099]
MASPWGFFVGAAVLIVTSAHLGARCDDFIGLPAHSFIFSVRLSVFISLKRVDAAATAAHAKTIGVSMALYFKPRRVYSSAIKF